MFIFISKETNEIASICGSLHYATNGYPVDSEKNIAYPTVLFDVIEVSNIPVGVELYKWCYTESDGFYPNPNYREPSAYDLAPQEVVDAIIDEYTNELIEMGVL